MTTNPDWADAEARRLLNAFIEEGYAPDSRKAIAAALRKARSEGEAIGERRGMVKAMREAAEIAQKRIEVYASKAEASDPLAEPSYTRHEHFDIMAEACEFIYVIQSARANAIEAGD